MKCNTCQTEVIIRDGKDSGYCYVCGEVFKVDKEGQQVYDRSVVKEIASAVADEMEERRKKRAVPPDPPDDPPDPPENPDKKWD